MTRTDAYTGDKLLHRRRFLIPDNYIQRNPSTDDIAREIDKIKTRLATEEGTERVFRTFPRPLVVTYDGTQQVLIDSASGAASRGLCASNFIRLAFAEYLSGKKNRKIISGLLTRETFVKIIDITRHYQRNRHLEVTNIIGAPFHQPFVDDTDTQPIAGLPYFAWTLSTDVLERNLKSLINLSRTEDSFFTVMQHLNNIASPIAGAVITASPEILSVLKLPLKSAPERKVFIVFDSNTYREYYPNGAGMVVFSSWQDAATFLARRLLKTQAQVEPEEESLDAGSIVNASFVVPRGPLTSSKANEILLEASMRILHLDAENSDLRDIIRIILSPDAPAPSSMQEQYQSRQPSGTELDLDGATRTKLASLYSEIERLRSDNTEPQTKSVSMQDAPDRQARVERQAREQQDQRQQHDRAGETCRSTCLGAEEARRFKQTPRVMEEMRQTLEEEWRATRKERQAMKEARRVMENERQATEAERLATKKERHAMEQAHLNFAQALRMANEASKYLANIAYHIDQTIRMAAAVAEQTRYGCSVVRRALGN
ncbi:hypothetical protein C0993_007239 [Termitomyces sp. T159_Od127]|nr:hypothetical protein C0993_007239 [Termitomyces sp. T159_Od127]